MLNIFDHVYYEENSRDSYKILAIKNITNETPSIKTLTFDWKLDDENMIFPGQFIMVWNFNGLEDEKDEKPMSVSKIDSSNNEIAITVKNIGPFTKGLHKLKVGDELALRGPYGNGFLLEGDNILAIGGGVGMAPISAFLNYALEEGKKVDLISSSQTKNELLFFETSQYSIEDSINLNIYTTTDDGTCGFKGFATHRAIELLKEKFYDMVVVCGPEIMMKAIFDILEENDISGQFSMERYMKCAMGICGQCCVDNTGWRICVEGPVFNQNDMKKIVEFGKYHRDSSGKKEFY